MYDTNTIILCVHNMVDIKMLLMLNKYFRKYFSFDTVRITQNWLSHANRFPHKLYTCIVNKTVTHNETIMFVHLGNEPLIFYHIPARMANILELDTRTNSWRVSFKSQILKRVIWTRWIDRIRDILMIENIIIIIIHVKHAFVMFRASKFKSRPRLLQNQLSQLSRLTSGIRCSGDILDYFIVFRE